ncbi:hypothetical protein BVRB_5g102850 [Beta vulgaris subsp. vulgaris]|nr:hypothetical protein BVRB_5g102850 [Beta vulgaris subsp. vulgaris]
MGGRKTHRELLCFRLGTRLSSLWCIHRRKSPKKHQHINNLEVNKFSFSIP